MTFALAHHPPAAPSRVKTPAFTDASTTATTRRSPRPHLRNCHQLARRLPAPNDHAGDDPPDRLVEHRQAIVVMLARDKQLAA